MVLRISTIPLAVQGFWTFILSFGGNYQNVRTVLIGGFGTLAVLLFFLGGFTNLMTLITMPRTWRPIKRGAGDPWFDSLPEPFNNDPPSVRYQELYREKLRQENEQLLRPLAPPRNRRVAVECSTVTCAAKMRLFVRFIRGQSDVHSIPGKKHLRWRLAALPSPIGNAEQVGYNG
jgi:hypothetical protein